MRNDLISVDQTGILVVQPAQIHSRDLSRHSGADGLSIPRLGEAAKTDIGVDGRAEDLVQLRLDRLVGQRDIWRLPLLGSGGFELRAPRLADWELIPAINFAETDEKFTVTAKLRGMDVSDFEIKLSQGALIIKGKKFEELEETEKDYHISERSFGRFQRSFRVPDGIDTAAISAAMKNGVLTIHMPKTTTAKESEKTIMVQKA